jgi:hypothetical protein
MASAAARLLRPYATQVEALRRLRTAALSSSVSSMSMSTRTGTFFADWQDCLNSARLGTVCCYSPEDAASWHMTAGPLQLGWPA